MNICEYRLIAYIHSWRQRKLFFTASKTMCLTFNKPTENEDIIIALLSHSNGIAA